MRRIRPVTKFRSNRNFIEISDQKIIPHLPPFIPTPGEIYRGDCAAAVSDSCHKPGSVSEAAILSAQILPVEAHINQTDSIGRRGISARSLQRATNLLSGE